MMLAPHRLLLILASAMVLSLVGCTFDASPFAWRACASDLDCPSDQLCEEGFCARGLLDVPEDAGPDEPDMGGPPDAELPDAAPPQDVEVPDMGDPPDADPPLCNAEELCNGADDDCDGQIDEGVVLGGACQRQGQRCQVDGVLVCRNGEPFCEGTGSLPEVCNGLDDDCDDQIDEGPNGAPLEIRCYDGEPATSGVGQCKPGVQRCMPGGSLGVCEGASYPSREVCDNLDNDCDGLVDEDDCPEDVGCSDGGREAFTDAARFPTIAGCSGGWPGQVSLRTEPTGEVCGDDLSRPCTRPADLCAPGWRVCAFNGDLNPLRGAVLTADVCNHPDFAGSGRWVAAASHCRRYHWGRPCDYDEQPDCKDGGECSEPICCGSGCGVGGCLSGLFRRETRISQPYSGGCGAMRSDSVNGVLCCRVQ